MDLKDYFYIGYTSKTHGVKGDLTIKLDVDDAAAYKKIKSVFLKMPNGLKEQPLSKVIIPDNKTAIVNLTDFKTIEEVKPMVGIEVYLPLSLLKPLKGTKFYFHEVIGFHVVDEIHGDIGTIKQVLEFPNQNLFQVINPARKEILIPAVNDIVKEVDRENKIIKVSAPEGLIEIYL
jgi:16S rRNA processing protein RimM